MRKDETDPRVELQRRVLDDMGKDARRDRLGRFMRSAAVSPTDAEDGAVSPTDEEKREGK